MPERFGKEKDHKATNDQAQMDRSSSALRQVDARTRPIKEYPRPSIADDAAGDPYCFLLYSDDAAGPTVGTPESDAEFTQWFEYGDEAARRGVLRAGDPVGSAITVRVRDGEVLTADGPVAETEETLAGYYLVRLPSREAAIEWAARVPLVGYGSVEIRPVMEFPES